MHSRAEAWDKTRQGNYTVNSWPEMIYVTTPTTMLRVQVVSSGFVKIVKGIEHMQVLED